MIELDWAVLTKIELLRLPHLFICLASVFFFVLLRNRLASIKEDKNHNALLYVAGAYLMWFFMDAYRFSGIMEPGESSLVVKMLSSYNNAFFLAALPFFGNPFPKWSWFNQSMKWAMTILVGNIILVMVFSLLWNYESAHVYIHYFDLVYSISTYLMLLIALLFQTRNKETTHKPILVFGMFLLVGLVLIQVLFSPLFKVLNFDVVSVLALVFQFLFIVVVVFLGFQKLMLLQEEQLTMEKSRAILNLENQILTLEQQLTNAKQNRQQIGDVSILTEREKEVLKCMELSYSEIGEKLFISRDTVISHKKNIESKLGVSGKSNLIDFVKNLDL